MFIPLLSFFFFFSLSALSVVIFLWGCPAVVVACCACFRHVPVLNYFRFLRHDDGNDENDVIPPSSPPPKKGGKIFEKENGSTSYLQGFVKRQMLFIYVCICVWY